MARVLVVDDDPHFGEMLLKWLEDEGYETERVVSAEEALEKIESLSFPAELFLVDQLLGTGKDGVTLIREIKNQLPNAEAILFTGLEEPDIAQRAFDAGAYRYLHRTFHPDELGWTLKAAEEWQKAKVAAKEREWLHILIDITNELQQATTVEEVGETLVSAGVRLGFDRSRFYTVREVSGITTLFGLCQAGENQIEGFERLSKPLDETEYSRRAWSAGEHIFFQGRQYGPGFLYDLHDPDRVPDSLGEWVSIPFFSGDVCLGILNMDNSLEERPIDQSQKDVLHLFVGNATAALERTAWQENEAVEKLATEIAASVTRAMGDPADEGALDRLLLAIREQFGPLGPTQNFIVSLIDPESGWDYYRLHIEQGAIEKPSWKAPANGGLIRHVIESGEALFKPQAVQEFRDQHSIRQVGLNPAKSWLGAPLKIGDKVFGAMVLEDDIRENAFNLRDFQLFVELGRQLVGIIQTAWLNELQRRFTDMLSMLQKASEKTIQLAVENEDWLWHSTLTLCTADYGAGFDRAMLFMVKQDTYTGRTRIVGRMGIGHLTKAEAHRAWEQYVDDEIDWDKYLEQLTNGQIAPTPLDAAVRSFEMPIDEDSNAFSEILHRKEPIHKITADEVATRLSPEFAERFGRTEYMVVPVKAGTTIIGIVLLDNLWETDPQQYGAVDYLDALTNQAALVYEILQSLEKQKKLVGIQRETLSASAERPFAETLRDVCAAANEIIGADIVSIDYLPDNENLRYDEVFSGYVDTQRQNEDALEHHAPGGFARTIIEEQVTGYCSNISTDNRRFHGERIADHPFVQEKGLQAVIGTPIKGTRHGTVRGLLFVNYRTPQEFRETDIQLAEAFAQLAGVAITNYREATGLREEVSNLEDELQLVSMVLPALNQEVDSGQAGDDEIGVIKAILGTANRLLANQNLKTAVFLKDWIREDRDSEPVPIIRRYYYSAQSDEITPIEDHDIHRGITSRVLASGEPLYTPDVRDVDGYYEVNSETLSEYDTPIILDDEIIGVLNLESPELNFFTERHEHVAGRLAEVTALALRNHRQQQTLRSVLRVASEVTEPVDLLRTLESISDEIRSTLPGLSMMTIWYKDPESGELKLGPYFGVRDEATLKKEVPRDNGMVRLVLSNGEPIWEEDVLNNRTFRKGTFVEAEGLKSSAVFPLDADNETIGVMFFSYRAKHTFNSIEKTLYPTLAHIVATSINDALYLQRAENERSRLDTTLRVTETISSRTTLPALIEQVGQQLEELYASKAVRAQILLSDERTGQLLLPGTLGSCRDSLQADDQTNGKGYFVCSLLDEAVRERKKVIRSGSFQIDGGLRPLDHRSRSTLAATLMSSTHSGPLGVLVLESPLVNAFDADDEKLIENIARQTRIAVERANREAELRFKSSIIRHTAWVGPVLHDANQEVGRILTRVDRLQSESLEEGIRVRFLREIGVHAHRIQGHIAETALQTEELTLVDLDQVIQEWVRLPLRSRSIPISLRIVGESKGFLAIVHQNKLKRAVYDIVRNAAESMERRPNQKLQVEISPSVDASRLEMRFTNNGPVIPPDVQVRLFNEPISTKETERRGFGLLFVRAVIEEMNGRVWLESSTEEGTEFVISLRHSAIS